MHIAFSAVILTWPFKGLIDTWSPRAIRCSIDERQGPRIPPSSLSIGIIVESGRDYYLSPFHCRDSGQSIRYRLHTYIVTLRFLESRDTLYLNIVVPIQRMHHMCDSRRSEFIVHRYQISISSNCRLSIEQMTLEAPRISAKLCMHQRQK